MSLTGREVAQILSALEESTFDTLDLEMNGVKIHLRRSGAPGAPPGATRPESGDTRPMPSGDAAPVPAPLLGIFYRAPKPGEPPFVQVGDRVAADTVIGIIEVMKLMNSVHAGMAGEVVEISADNGQMVEYGQALLWIRRD